MTIYFTSEAILAEVVHYPHDVVRFSLEWEGPVSEVSSYCYRQDEDISAQVLTGSDSSVGNLQFSKVLTLRTEDIGWVTMEFRANRLGQNQVRRLVVRVPDYDKGPYAGKPKALFPASTESMVHIWNSAATITSASTRVYRDGVDISAQVLTGYDQWFGNVQSGRALTPREEDTGEELVYEFRAEIEGNIFNRRVLIVVPPRF